MTSPATSRKDGTMTTQPATWDPAMDGAALLERVFEHQRAAEHGTTSATLF